MIIDRNVAKSRHNSMIPGPAAGVSVFDHEDLLFRPMKPRRAPYDPTPGQPRALLYLHKQILDSVSSSVHPCSA